MYVIPADNPKWAQRRLANLSAGKEHRSCTFQEASYLHWYFNKSFGQAWGNLISPKDFVTRPVAENINKGLRAGLQWPMDLPVAFGLQSVFRLNSDPNLSLQFVEAPSDGPRGMQSSTRPMAEMRYTEDNRPVHPVDWLFLVRVAGIQRKNVFLFETYDSEVEFTDQMASDDLFSIFPQNLVQVEGDRSDIPAFDGSAFEIINLPGSFMAHAMTFPDDWDFQERFDVNPNPYPDPWTLDEGREFLENVQKWLNHEPDALQLASYAYRV
jgi:hypothetical protein